MRRIEKPKSSKAPKPHEAPQRVKNNDKKNQVKKNLGDHFEEKWYPNRGS